MRSTALLGTLLSISLLAPAVASAGEGEWEFLRNDDGVDVFRKEVPGSDVVAFRGVMTADLPIGKILAVFKDPGQRKHWVDRYAEHTTFERGSDTETYWIHFSLPWPISDRDYILRADGQRNDGKRAYTVKIKSVEHAKKGEDDCCVRAQVYGTYYEFTALPGSDKTKVVVEVHTDPKGALPNWLVNLIQKSWPGKTLHGLINHAKEAKLAPLAEYADWHKPAEVKAVEVKPADAVPAEAKPAAAEAPAAGP